ncbi:hypothetical protein GCM10010399_42030 [Dactylosporangium fulvum]|uniref:Integral membrane protein n=1 Tax=Dactylosporangium fulvum TaxID=53359 RepID=A0ABY5VXT4_9ACTN|nr:hypothetical protein [Dactylosporangium fulvum]UWP81614.1 hypothetical protein Dfulv_41950 [Dactylosporangium fulvum]
MTGRPQRRGRVATRVNEPEPLPAWLAWPIRVIAVIVVVPFKLAWDGLVAVSRFLWRYGLKPVAWFVYQWILRPVAYALYYVIWVPIRWLVVHVFWRPLAWLGKHVLVPLLTALWNGLVAFLRWTLPFWRFLGRVLVTAAGAVIWTLQFLYRYVLTPIGVGLYRFLLRPIGLTIAWIWRWIVVPIGMAVAWAWNHSVVLLWRYLVVIPVSWTWRTLVVPPVKWVHAAILRPAADAVRRVLATLGLR